MQPATPIYANVALVLIDLLSSFETGAGVHRAELEEPVENWTIVAEIEGFVILERDCTGEGFL